jgi:mycoredoxin
MLKKLAGLILIVAIYQNWYRVDAWLHPVQLPTSDNPQQVILYATSWCGYCKKTRALFKELNVDYREFDIETSADGKAQHAALVARDGGSGGVPVIVIGQTVVHGYDEQGIRSLLAMHLPASAAQP